MVKFVLLFFVFCTHTFAASVDIEGGILYQMPDGNLVKRLVTLEVPVRGKGDIFIKSQKNQFKADQFFSAQKNGRTLFYIVFTKFPGGNPGEEAVFRGTYLRGKNKIFYAGEVFKMRMASKAIEEIGVENALHSATYVAAFKFTYDR